MENENVFTYQYSAVQNKEVERIRSKYLPREKSGMDKLRSLDAKVKNPANIFAYIFGSISAIIMGSGMSLVMTDVNNVLGFKNPMTLGITVGIIGMIMALINYPIHNRILNLRKKKYGAQIIALSDKIMNY